MRKNCLKLRNVGLARFGEIIYNPANTPAVGVNFILAPNMGMIFHVRTAEMTVPASHFALQQRSGVRTSVFGDQTERGNQCPNP